MAARDERLSPMNSGRGALNTDDADIYNDWNMTSGNLKPDDCLQGRRKAILICKELLNYNGSTTTFSSTQRFQSKILPASWAFLTGEF